jgi:hypothetical protein
MTNVLPGVAPSTSMTRGRMSLELLAGGCGGVVAVENGEFSEFYGCLECLVMLTGHWRLITFLRTEDRFTGPTEYLINWLEEEQ